MKRLTMQPRTLQDIARDIGDPALPMRYPDGFEPGLPETLRQSYRTHRAERNAGEEFEVTIPGRGVLTWLSTEVPMRRYRFRAEEAYGRAKGLEPVTEGRW